MATPSNNINFGIRVLIVHGSHIFYQDNLKNIIPANNDQSVH
jgi:hypothetical protein